MKNKIILNSDHCSGENKWQDCDGKWLGCIESNFKNGGKEGNSSEVM